MSGWTHLCSLEGSSQSLTLPLMSEQHRECCRKPETRSLQMFSLLCPSSLNYFWKGLVPFGFYFPQPALTNFCGFVLQIKTYSFDCNWNGFPTVNSSFIVQDYEVHKFKLHKFKLHINMNDYFAQTLCSVMMKVALGIFDSQRIFVQTGWHQLKSCFFFSRQIQIPWVG